MCSCVFICSYKPKKFIIPSGRFRVLLFSKMSIIQHPNLQIWFTELLKTLGTIVNHCSKSMRCHKVLSCYKSNKRIGCMSRLVSLLIQKYSKNLITHLLVTAEYACFTNSERSCNALVYDVCQALQVLQILHG